MDNNYLLFIGISFLFIGGIDFLHTLSYEGMGVFPGYGPNLATQLWVSARYLESLSLLVAPLLICRRLHVKMAFLAYALATCLILASIFYWHIFPTAFIEGAGLTSFKVISEYIISLILAVAIWLLFRHRSEFNAGVFKLLVASIAITIASEMAFTLYTDEYGVANMIGHVLKIASFYLIYKALIETGLRSPYDLLFRNLKQSEEKYHKLFSTMTEGFGLHEIILDDSGKPCDYRFIEVNDTFSELTGLSNVEGKTVLELIPALEPHWIEMYGKVALGGEPVQFESFSAPLDRWYEIYAYSPNKGYFVTLFLDITERKKTELMKDEFISLVSHELRTPLTVISGSLQTAMSPGISEKDIRELLQNAADDADILAAILENMLELSRYQADRLQLCMEPVSIADVAGSVIGKLKSQGSSHRFLKDFPPDLPLVEADPLRVERILYNLLENAIKYSPAASEIKVSAHREEGFVITSVTDQGRGISPDNRSKLFKLFERFPDESYPVQGQGLGLGLVVCKRLVEAQGGQIWVESAPGSGSTFFFSLSISREG